MLPGLFWVPGGAFNIFAIRNAGLAISQGIVASSIVMVCDLDLSECEGSLSEQTSILFDIFFLCNILLVYKRSRLYGVI